MKRRIIKQGRSTLTISLPSEWTKEFNLKPGDEVEVITHKKDLCISTKKSFKSQKSELDLRGIWNYINWTYINNAYIRGDDEIKILFDNEETKELANEVSAYLLGFAVVEQCKKYFIIKELTESKEVELDAIIRRIFILIKMLSEDALDYMKKNDLKNLNDLRRRDGTINTFVSFCLRTLNKRGYHDFQKTILYSNLILLLEQLGDEFNRLCKNVKEPLKKEHIKLYEEIVWMIAKHYDSFYNYNKAKAKELWDKRDEIREKIPKLLGKCSINEATFLYRIQKIAETIVDILKVQIGFVL